jgi:hypothetical protein
MANSASVYLAAAKMLAATPVFRSMFFDNLVVVKVAS